MKIILIYIITFYSSVYAQDAKNIFSNNIENISLSEKNIFLRMNRMEHISGASANFKVTYYRCEWEIDPAIRFISGKVTSIFLLTQNADQIIYDLSDSLVIDSIKEKNNLISFSQLNNTVQINFNETKPAGSLDSVSIFYHGVPPNTGFGSFVVSAHEGTPVLWTLSEPYGARDWWPCRNGLDDKADSIDVYITTPEIYTAVSNGLRQSEIITEGKKTTYWKHRYPIASYLVCMAATNYTEFNDHVQIGNTNLLMQTFCYPEGLQMFQNGTPPVLAALQFYSTLFGPYPFIKEKYGHVQFGWGGGQEHQTSTFILRPDEGLVAHELGHQWFGDKITCASWQEIWLNEGFATFLSSLYMEKTYPLTAISTRKYEIDRITSLPNGSVFVSDTTNPNRIFDSRLTYTKGSHLLYMLRWILGDSAFFSGMRNYANDTSIAYGFAHTTDFQRNMEKASGKKLDYFFKDWLYGEGYPTYNVQWTQLGDNYVNIKINQKTSDASVPFFALPVALKFKNATDSITLILNNTTNGESFLRKTGFIADTVMVDPEYWLISRNNTSQKVPDDISGENIVQVYPSPFINSFNLFLRKFNSPQVLLTIFDTKGRLMMKKNLTVNGSLFYEVATPALTHGIYFLKLQTDKGFNFVQKILKQ